MHTHTTCVQGACHCPRPRCSMCAVTEPYAWGHSGNNMCPENAVRIGSTEACHRAARVMGKVWAGSDYSTDRPRGCFWNEGTNSSGVFVFFNAHPVGSGSAHRLPLCAVGTSPFAFACDMPWPSAGGSPSGLVIHRGLYISISQFLETYT